MNFLQGKKTYVVAGLFLVAFVLQVIFKVQIPEAVYGVLTALGLAAFRSAIASITENQGWRTYLAAIATLVISVLNFVGVNIPLETIYGILAAVGITGVRKAIEAIETAE